MNGVEKEIDFRIRIMGEEVYFGVSHFYGWRKDLEKDTEDVDIEVFEVKRGKEVLPGKGKIVGVRPHNEYLNRRMAVRVAREGRHKFKSDYIYIFFPKLDRGRVFTREIYTQKCNAVYQHIFESYYGEGRSVYAAG